MRAMRSSLPIFIFIGLALMAVIGIIIFGAAATSASVAVNNSSSEELASGIYTIEYGIIFGIGGLLFIVALYFVLKNFT